MNGVQNTGNVVRRSSLKNKLPLEGIKKGFSLETHKCRVEENSSPSSSSSYSSDNGCSKIIESSNEDEDQDDENDDEDIDDYLENSKLVSLKKRISRRWAREDDTLSAEQNDLQYKLI